MTCLTSPCRLRVHIAGPENRARGSLSSVVRRRVLLQLGAHLPKERYAYAARKSSAKFRYSYNWLSPDLPFSSPNDLSISHSQRVSRKVSWSLAASVDPYENVPEGTRLAGPKSDPEPAGTRLQQSGITVRACVIHQRTGDQTAQSINLPVITLHSPYRGRRVSSSITVHPSRHVRLGG